MTIALGMLCDGGAVIATDRQWTAGDWKFEGGKTMSLSRLVGPDQILTAVSAGAGTHGSMVGAWEVVREQWRNSLTLDELRSKADKHLAAFYQKRILRFSTAPDPPGVDLVIGASTESQAALWVTENYALIDAGPYCAIGNGWSIARLLLDRFYPTGLRLFPFGAIVLAIHVISQVKASETSCGRDTEITCLHGGRAVRVPPDLTRDLELKCEQFLKHERAFFFRAIGEWQMVADASLDHFAKNFGEVRQVIDVLLSHPVNPIRLAMDHT